MAYISKLQFKNIIDNAPPGTSPEGILKALEKQGHVVEGFNDQSTSQLPSDNPSSPGADTSNGVPEKKSVGGFIKNTVKSGVDLVKNTAQAAVNVFNPDSQKNTVANVGRVALGTAEKAIPGRQGAEDQADAVGQMLADRYGGWDKIKQTAYEDPLGFLLDASTVLDGAGIALRTAGTAGKINELTKAGELASRASKVIDPIQAATKVGEGAVKVGENVVGATTGAGGTAIREGFDAAKAGGETKKAFTSSMRGADSGEELLGTAKDALHQLKENRASTYQKQLASIKTSEKVLDLTPVRAKVDDMLGKFGIKQATDEVTGKPKLDFNTSTVSDPAEQARIQRIYDDVSNWSDATPVGVDTLKRRIANEFSPNSDVRAFTQAVKSETTSLLKKNVPATSL